jgi:hypothetical protein
MTVKEVENPFLGSRMRKLFGLLPTDEKLKIDILKRDIQFERIDNGIPVSSQVYDLPQNTWETISYLACMGGDVGGRPDLVVPRHEKPAILDNAGAKGGLAVGNAGAGLLNRQTHPTILGHE